MAALDAIIDVFCALRSNYDVSPFQRLRIYDALCPGLQMISRVRARQEKFNLSAGVHYSQLALVTARSVLPIWDADFSSLHRDDKNYEEMRQFPHGILCGAGAMLSGAQERSLSKVKELGNLEPYTALGAMPYEVHYYGAAVADAAYGALMAVNGCVPFCRMREAMAIEEATDVELNAQSGNWDVAWHAANASSAIDPDPPGTEVRTEITFDRKKRVAFWEWWLKDAIAMITDCGC